jgi:hypothetical protein
MHIPDEVKAMDTKPDFQKTADTPIALPPSPVGESDGSEPSQPERRAGFFSTAGPARPLKSDAAAPLFDANVTQDFQAPLERNSGCVCG